MDKGYVQKECCFQAFFKHCIFVPTLGPLHKLFPLAGTPLKQAPHHLQTLCLPIGLYLCLSLPDRDLQKSKDLASVLHRYVTNGRHFVGVQCVLVEGVVVNSFRRSFLHSETKKHSFALPVNSFLLGPLSSFPLRLSIS